MDTLLLYLVAAICLLGSYLKQEENRNRHEKGRQGL